MHITTHVKHQWRRRVDACADYAAAEAAIAQMLEHGKWSHRPKRWTTYKEHPRARYVSWCERPGVLLVCDLEICAVVTVVTRAFALASLKRQIREEAVHAARRRGGLKGGIRG